MHKSRFRFFVLPILLLVLLLPLCTGVHGADLGVERSVFQFLTAELGLNSAAACGVLANIEAESNFSLTAYGDGGTSYGLCQWHDGRFEALQSFCLLYGYDYWSLDGQLNYLAYELRTRYQSTYAALKRVANTSDGAYEAGYVWCVSFEVPANREEKGVIRGRTAQFKYWLRYGGSSDFSASMGVTSRGYSGALSGWSDSSSSFYWETDDNIEEPTAPISAPSSATQTPSPVERPTTPAAESNTQVASATPSHRIPQFRYVPHHMPASLPAPAASPATQPSSPLACLFLCAGEPAKRFRMPQPEEEEPCE